MAKKAVFVVYADHELTPLESDFFQEVCSDLKENYMVRSRPNARNLTGETILESIERGLETSDCVVAFLNKRSDTVGMVVQMAFAQELPVLGLYTEGGEHNITRTYFGLQKRGDVQLRSYRSASEAVGIAKDFVRSVAKAPKS